jgi:hypothetical protein
VVVAVARGYRQHPVIGEGHLARRRRRPGAVEHEALGQDGACHEVSCTVSSAHWMINPLLSRPVSSAENYFLQWLFP